MERLRKCGCGADCFDNQIGTSAAGQVFHSVFTGVEADDPIDEDGVVEAITYTLDTIKDIKVEKTIIGGKTEFERK